MTGGIFLVQGDGELVEMNEQRYDSEDLLQGLLARYPRLLSGDDPASTVGGTWLLVEREVGVPDAEEAPDRWSVDHLFIDQNGVPTLVEVKRSTDTRIRREVVGQMLDYAANTIVYWPIETIRAKFEARCEREGKDPTQELASTQGPDLDPEVFWQDVKTNLQAGRVRMLFVSDVIPPELRRVVEFLNTQMDPAEVLALEVRQFVGKDLKTLVPRLIGQTAETIQKKRPSSGPIVTQGQFLERVESARGFFEALLESAAAQKLIVTWGVKGFSVSTPFEDGRLVLFYGYPAGVYTDNAHCLMTDLAMLSRKVQGGPELAAQTRTQLAGKPGWQSAGNERKYLIDRPLDQEETKAVIDFFNRLKADIIARGPVAV